MALVLAACGGGETSGASGAPVEDAVDYEMYAKDVNTGADAVNLYASRMNQLAEALEQIENKAGAERAAIMIAQTAQEYELLDARLKELGRTDMARSLADSGYSEMYMRRYMEAQTRLAAAMNKVAEENPRYMLKLGTALQKVQGRQSL